MTPEPLNIALSEIDEVRFGYRTAKASQVTLSAIPEVLTFCRAHHVQLLIVRCSAKDTRVAQALESAGCFLTDTLVYYARNLTRTPIPTDTGRIPIRPLRSGEEEAVTQVAAEAFHGYLGHYHADSRLDSTACDAVYSSWARTLCLSRSASADVLVATHDGAIVGFLGLRLNNLRDGEGVLNAVAPALQGHGIYTSLVIRSLEWCRDKGAEKMLISTQLSNFSVQRVWARLGFELSSAQYTFHKWFDYS